MEVADVIERYGLTPLEGEGGWYRFITRFSGLEAGSIYYLVTPTSFSSLHRLSEDELWFFLDGDECEQLTFSEEDGESSIAILGKECRHSLVKAGLWQATRLKEGGRWALFSTVMCPHYDEGMYSAPDEAMLERHPFLKDYLNA